MDVERRPFSKTSFSLLRQHRNICQEVEQNLDVSHPDGGGLQPQIEMGHFLMAAGEPRRGDGESKGEYWANYLIA